MNRLHSPALLAAVFLVIAPDTAQSQDTLTVIDFPGAIHTRPFVITANGDLAGLYMDATGTHGFVLDHEGMRAVDLAGAVFTNVVGMNTAGALVGWYALTPSAFRGYLLQEGVFTSIDVPGAVRTFASGINGDGDIVGHYTDTAGVDHAFLYRAGTFVTFDVPGANLTQAVDINARGDLLGVYRSAADATFHMFVLSPEGELLSIDYPGARHTGASGVGLGISPNGALVGQYRDANLVIHGFVLDEHGYAAIDIPDATATVATGINARGTIVGRYRDASGRDHGFVLSR